MRFKFILAIALILCAFSVLPINALSIDVYQSGEQNFTLGNIQDETIFLNWYNNNGYFDITQTQYPISYRVTGYQNCNLPSTNPNYVTLDKESNFAYFMVAVFNGNTQITTANKVNIYYQYSEEIPITDYDIDIDLQEQTLELGIITDLYQTFDLGSSTDRVIQRFTSYASMSCTIDDLQRNYVKIKFDKDYNYSEIFLSGKALKDSTESDFTTQVKFNYTYMPLNDIQAFIQTYDYQNGNILSGVNMSIYEVIENGDNLEIGNLIYSSLNSESQTILMLKQDTDYFIENELTGYFAVKNENIASLNNRYGYLWNPTLINPLRLYYSRLDPSAQYNANFIVQDVNNNGIAGVTVTMDNSITKISNSIGGLTFNNVSAGPHTFTFTKNGYQSAQRTIDIQLQYAAFTQTLFKDDQIIQPTVSPSIYPTIQPTVSPSDQPTLSPIDKPSNIMESVTFGFAKIFGVKTVENANYIFALMLILFPAVIAGGITHQALGFIAGGMVGFVFALAVGLIPIWVFFAMCLMAVIYIVLKGGNEGF